MAITINIPSLTPNLANNRVIYSIDSTKSNEPQFKFVLDINDRNGNLLQRLKQQPNQLYGEGIFDIGQILTNYLGPTDEVWTVGKTGQANTPAINRACGDQFQIRFGEEYALSSTGSADIYPGTYTGGGSAAPGDPAVSSSYYNFFIDGVLDINTYQSNIGVGGFNWYYPDKYEEEDTYGTTTFNHQFGLTSFNTSSVRLGDYHTLSFLNGNLLGLPSASLDNTEAQDVYAMVIQEFDSTGASLGSNTYYNLGSNKRSTATELWDDIYLFQQWTTQIVHFPAGPQNLDGLGLTLNANTAYYTLTFHSQTPEPGVNDNGVWGEYRFNVKDAACDYPGTRFAYKNEFGVWDYFNFELATSATSNIEREEFEQTYIDYGASIAVNDVERRGQSQFQNRINKLFTAESNYLNQTDADNLRELFYSTNVYVQDTDNERYLPIVIENASVTEKTNPRSQKLFRYTVEYRYANELQPRV